MEAFSGEEALAHERAKPISLHCPVRDLAIP